MKVSSHERSDHRRPGRTAQSRYGLSIAGLLLLMAVGWWLYDSRTDEPARVEPVEILEAQPLPEVKPLPLIQIPRRQPKDSPLALPPLTESDALVREEILDLDNEKLARWTEGDNLIQRGIAFIDGLSRGALQPKLMNLPRPADKFMVRKQDGKLWLDPGNYRRFDSYSTAIESIDSAKLTDLFHLLRPLLQQAYGELGYNPEKIDSALVGAIDHLLAAPVKEAPIELVHRSVNYQFADPALERLPAAHKLLLRAGPENTRRIQAKLKDIRQTLLSAQPSTER